MSLGFIINSFWNDQKELPLEIFGVSEEGPFMLAFDTQQPLFFVSQKASLPPGLNIKETKDLPLKSFDGEAAKALYFHSLQAMYEGRDKLNAAGVRSYENDIRPENRFLMERFINSSLEFEGEFIQSGALRIYHNPPVKSAWSRPRFSTLSLDIETGRDGSLYSVGLSYCSHASKKEVVYMLGESSSRVNELLELCQSEKEVLEKSMAFIKQTDPDLLLGWHVVGFDLSFLAAKAQKNGVELDLGRDGSPLELTERGNSLYASIKGRIILDGPPVLRSNFFSFSNMKLDTVANEVLGAGKDISASGKEKVEEIERRFREDKEALAFYNIEDCRLVHEIYKKLGIYELLIARSLYSGQQIDKVGVSTASFDHFYLPRLHRKGLVAPNVTDMTREEQSAGGMVIEPKAGLFKNVAVFDFKSLYPSIIRTFSIDPLARLLAAQAPSSELVNTPGSIAFARKEAILPEFLKELGDKRTNAKNNGNEPLSQAIKILMNSFYGVMGSPRSRFYHADLPTAITTAGHWILNQSIDYFDNLGLKVLYGDTDSLFVQLEGAWLEGDKTRELAKNLNHFLAKIIKDEFDCDSCLEVEYEKLYDQIFFGAARSSAAKISERGSEQGAKKRYVGYADRTMSFIGMEYVRSDWTGLAKDFQFELFQRLFEGEPLEIFIKEEIKKLESGLYDHKLVYSKRLSKKLSEYTKSAPPHIKAALQLPVEKQKRLRSIEYVMTMQGPKPLALNKDQPDYRHYIEKQIRPVAQTVLLTQGLSFDEIHVGNQLNLF